MENTTTEYCILCRVPLVSSRITSDPLPFHCSLPCLVVWKQFLDGKDSLTELYSDFQDFPDLYAYEKLPSEEELNASKIDVK